MIVFARILWEHTCGLLQGGGASGCRRDALWRIAYSSYGEGVRFVDIVRRNAGAISDPDLIFPNQIFTIPD